jgi:hypothetical protein
VKSVVANITVVSLIMSIQNVIVCVHCLYWRANGEDHERKIQYLFADEHNTQSTVGEAV